jgi:hypothetical protein
MWIMIQNIFLNGMIMYKYQGYAPKLQLFELSITTTKILGLTPLSLKRKIGALQKNIK